MKGIYKRTKKLTVLIGHLRFSLRPLTPQPGDYRNFMLHVLLAVFKIRYIFAFCSAAGRTELPEVTELPELPELCSAAGNAPSMAYIAILTASLAALFQQYHLALFWQRCSVSTNLALFWQRHYGTRLQTYLQTQPQYFSLCCQKLIGQLKFHGRGF